MSTAILTARFRILTPLFLGDAFHRPRLRAPAIKGVLRFWYRALDPGFKEREGALFGGQANKIGQSPWLLTVEKNSLGQPVPFAGGGIGLNYLGYPFKLRGGEREAIAPGKVMTLHCLIPTRGHDPQLRRALAGSLWCLGHLGALGTRSRRGFGALALESWEGIEGDWPELEALPLLAGMLSAEAAVGAINTSVACFRGWFGKFDELIEGERPQPHLGPKFRFKLQDTPHDNWSSVLNGMGEKMQAFRSTQKRGDVQLAADALRGRRIDRAPDRATFGLPLSFRFRNERGSITFLPVDPERRKKLERQGSLLFLRPVLIGGKLYPLYLRMDGAVPGETPPAGTQREREPLNTPAHNAMDEFFDQLRGEIRHG